MEFLKLKLKLKNNARKRERLYLMIKAEKQNVGNDVLNRQIINNMIKTFCKNNYKKRNVE